MVCQEQETFHELTDHGLPSSLILAKALAKEKILDTFLIGIEMGNLSSLSENEIAAMLFRSTSMSVVGVFSHTYLVMPLIAEPLNDSSHGHQMTGHMRATHIFPTGLIALMGKNAQWIPHGLIISHGRPFFRGE